MKRAHPLGWPVAFCYYCMQPWTHSEIRMVPGTGERVLVYLGDTHKMKDKP